MTEVTVRKFAHNVGIPIERLLTQLGDAGMSAKNADDNINDDEKFKLLGHLRRMHGKIPEKSTHTPKRITIQRKTKSEIRVPGSAGRAKTVPVEVRKKRTYVKRGGVDTQRSNNEPERLNAVQGNKKPQQVPATSVAQAKDGGAVETSAKPKRQTEQARTVQHISSKEKATAVKAHGGKEQSSAKKEIANYHRKKKRISLCYPLIPMENRVIWTRASLACHQSKSKASVRGNAG